MSWRIRSLLIPYFGFASISLFYYIIYPQTFTEIISKFFYYKGETIWNEPLWFLFSLFLVELISYTLMARFTIFMRNNKVLLFFIIMLLLLGYLIYQIRPLILMYFGIDRALFLSIFYLFGFYLKQIQFIKLLKLSKIFWLIILLINSAISLICNWNNNISVYYFDLNNYFIFVFTSIVGSICLIALFQNIVMNKYIKSISKHSIFILGTHYMILLVYIWISKMIMIDSLIFCLPILFLYTVLLTRWDFKTAKIDE
jgi:hypothetical protein